MSEEAEAEILAEIANVAEDGLKEAADYIGEEKVQDQELLEDPGTPLGDEYQAPEESEEEDDIQITIGDLRSNVTTFRPAAPNAVGGQKGAAGVVSGAIGKQGQKLDLDAVADIEGTPLFDVALSLVTGTEEAPWRKPGADITDYFNYGFTEHTWLSYCERQQKLRAEYGSQSAANRALFASLTGTAPAGVAAMAFDNKPRMGGGMGDLASSMMVKMQSLPVIMRTRLTLPSANESTNVDVPLSTIPQSVPSLASSVPLSHSALQNLQTAAQLQLSSSPPVSPGMTPPPDDEEDAAGFGRRTPVVEPTALSAAPASTVDMSLAPPSAASAATAAVAASVERPPSVQIAPLMSMAGAPTPGAVSTVTAPPPATESLPFPNLAVPPPCFPPTNLPPPGFPPPAMMAGMPGMPPTNVPPPLFPPGALPPPPGMSVRFPPPFGFPPPSTGQRPPHFARESFVAFNRQSRDEARSPASYSDKSSDDESSRRDRRRPPGVEHMRSSSIRVGGGMAPGGSYQSRERSSRSSRRRSRSRSRERSHRRGDSVRRRSSREHKHRRGDDKESTPSSSSKKQKIKIKEEPLDEEEEVVERSSSSKKSKSEHKEKSSSGKKKRKKEKHDVDDGGSN